MATARDRMDEDSFLCSICLSVFTKPVSIACGHNFCYKCISDYWDTVNTIYQCPLCKEEFDTRPMLQVNSLIAQMVEKVKKSVQDKSSNKLEQAGTGHALCDLCTGAKVRALKSCSACFLSYCKTHLETHQRNSALKKHKLINPVKNLKSRVSKDQDKLPSCQHCEQQAWEHKKTCVRKNIS